MLINVENASFSYGDNLIFENASFTVNEGERVGLIGANGEGKTTLIKLICGGLDADCGSVTRKNGATIGYLEQNGGYTSGNTVYAEMLEVFKDDFAAVERLEELALKLAETSPESAEYKRVSARIESLEKYIASRDCYNAEVKIKTVLNGVGFADSYDRIIDTLSGGEKTRLKLARLLLESPDMLILDEPTNHLDIATLYWLEEYLASFKGAILVVSHDRYFLDRVVLRVLEIENKKLVSFAGNYSKYKVLKAERNARMLKDYEAQREERAKLQDYVDRNIVRATTAKSAQSRVKQLEKMEILEKPYIPPKPPVYRFNYDMQPYETVIDIDGLNLGIGGKRLISAGQLKIRRGEKVALVGENGTGKSTLLKAIVKGGNPQITVGRHVKPAYYDQEGANLDGKNTVIAELWERHVGLTQTEVRSALARCGLFEEDMQKPVCALSGGERAKLGLCVLECERGNFLIMDEPTNHLDLPARESLERALKEFDGTLLFVSHDRYFLNAVAGRVVEIADGKLNRYDCGYESYGEAKRKQREEQAQKREEEKFEKRQAERENSYRSKKERAQDARKKELLKHTENKICELEERESELNLMLADGEIAADYLRVNGILEELNAIKLQLDALYKEYETMI